MARLWDAFFAGFATFSFIIFGSLILIIIGLLYFILTLWIVKFGANLVGYKDLSADWAVLSASIIAVGSIMSSSMQKRV